VGSEFAISVVIPAYNRAAMLPRALRSVWAQQPELPAEVIVVDDGSKDDTAAVAGRLGARVIRHGENRGLSAARNTGLQAATQPWVALLDSDDEWLPHHLAHLWQLRGSHVLVAASALRRAEDPRGDEFHGPISRRPAVLPSADTLMFPGNLIPVSAAMVKRDAALAAGGFVSRKGVVEDLDLWLRVLERGTAICSPRVGLVYHLHDGQMSSQRRTMQLAHIEACEAHRQRTGGSRAPIRRWEGAAAWENMRVAIQGGERRDAVHWASYIAAHPRRLQGLVEILAFHAVSRRRVATLHAADTRAAR
jgi:Glycosyl transferase family 2